MKKVFLSVLTVIALGIAMIAQANVYEGDAPNVIQTAFNKLFPKATDVVWDQDENQHVFYFNDSETAKYCRLDATGKWLEKGIELTKSLPTNVSSMIASTYEESLIVEKYSVELSNKTSGFLVLIEMEDEMVELLIGTDGNVIRERALPTEQEWDDEGDDDDDGGK